MVDLTRDEWDDMQEGWDANGSPVVDMDWTCDYCSGPANPPYFEGGDLIECEGCNIRLDAKEYYNRGEYVHVDIFITENGNLYVAEGYLDPIIRHLLKG